ncbi:MAG: hypothetical protein PUD59_03630 [bacterium]|nr:hypothetical protein [bacterium]
MEIFFQGLLYTLGSILLVILIILSLKLINTVDKTNEILNDVHDKVKATEGLFNAINMTSNAISSIGDRIMDKLFSLIGRISKNKRKKNEEDEEYE